MTTPVVLILGARPDVGKHVARAFAAKGYKIALTSRTAQEEDGIVDQVHIAASLGLPGVVIYNAGAATENDKERPLSIPLGDFTRDLTINTSSAFAAAQQAALGFEHLPASASKTFIYTGNILNTTTMASLMDLGVSKSATAHMIQSAAVAYEDQGFKFYYADERKPDGSATYFDIDVGAHAQHYTQLAEHKSQGPWQQTFVKGVGYEKF